MTVREAGKGIVRSGGGTYRIGYTDLYEWTGNGTKCIRDEGSEELWSSLCPEFECRKNSICYIERA